MNNAKKRILVVDDDPRVLLILQLALERAGRNFEIEVAHNGLEALGKCEEKPFDLVITDVRMPGIDGIELVRGIRSLNQDSAVIWITAYSNKDLQVECDRLNVYCFLDKPLRIGEIREAALAALG